MSSRQHSPSTFCLAAIALLAVTATNATSEQSTCAEEKVVVGGCDKNDKEYCSTHCNIHGETSSTFLSDKCCIHAGVNANLLAFEESETWVPRLEEFNKCTGANVRLHYLAEREDGMGEALIQDVGKNDEENSGEGIYDAYIVQAPWMPPIFKGLQSLSDRIARDNAYIQFDDINQASRRAVSYEGEVRALPLDTDYIAMGWRQDIFENPTIQQKYYELYDEDLKVPDTIEEMVIVSERLNGRFDFNNDGEMDFGVSDRQLYRIQVHLA